VLWFGVCIRPVVPLVARLYALAIIASVLAGCGARGKPAAAPADPDYDWSQFHGGAEAPSSSIAKQDAPPAKHAAEPEKKAEADKQAEPEKQETKVVAEAKAAEDDATKPAASDTRKISAAKIADQSISEVSADALAEVTQRATKRSVVSTNVIVGAEYEQVSVVLKELAVQIVRPAATPDKSGPKVRSPKARKGDVARTEAAFYDPKADVLVLVRASKKATSARALAALVSHAAAHPAPAKKHARGAKPKRAS
jgi:hypothetical protein